MYFKAEIDNSDPSYPIDTIQWTQMDPSPSSDSVTLFLKDDYGVTIDTGDVVKVKMSAFNYMSSAQLIKMQVVVTNTNGDTAIDINEFYLNDSPFPINTVYSASGGTNSKEAMITDFSFDTTQWYDNIDDDTQELTFRTYFTYNKINYMITDFTSTNNITVKLPYFSKVYGKTDDIDICVEAKDKYEAITSSCQELIGAVSNYLDIFDILMEPFPSMNMSDHNNILLFTNYINFLKGKYELNEIVGDYSCPAAGPYICKLDYHCNYNGK